jgi:hypothetical protein
VENIAVVNPDNEIEDDQVQRTSDPQTNRVLEVLMNNFGASIRKKILEMQRLAEL